MPTNPLLSGIRDHHPKQILDICRVLRSGKAEACGPLCNLFDQQTNHGRDLKAYDQLLH